MLLAEEHQCLVDLLDEANIAKVSLSRVSTPSVGQCGPYAHQMALGKPSAPCAPASEPPKPSSGGVSRTFGLDLAG